MKTNERTITGGTFNYNVDNYNTTIGGSFESLEFVSGTIGGTVKITSSLKIWGDTFSADTLINLSNADLGEEISFRFYHLREMYVGEQIVLPEGYCVFTEDGVYAETLNSATPKYVICKHSHELNGYGYDGNNHWQTCDCGYVDTAPHTPTYSASGSTITVSRSVNCGYTGTAAISAIGKTYDGTALEATVTKTGCLAEKTIEVTYAVKDSATLESAPVNAGTYTASITYEGATASVEFTIAQKELTPAISGSVSKIYDGTNTVPTGYDGFC